MCDAADAEQALKSIEEELVTWHAHLEKEGKLIEAQRLYQRTMFDLEMIREIGYCMESRIIRAIPSAVYPGEAPPTLLDYLPHDHNDFYRREPPDDSATRGMYHGDRSRKGRPGQLRLPAAEREGQPSADFRGVSRTA